MQRKQQADSKAIRVMPESPNRRGPRKRGDELVAERRRQVCEAAADLFSTLGFHETTIEAVASAAKVSTGLIYKYFRDKEDLLFYSISDLHEDYSLEISRAVACANDPIGKFRAMVHAYARAIDRRKRTVLLANRASYALGRERMQLIMQQEVAINSVVNEIIDECIAARVFREIDAKMLTYQIVTFVNSWPLKAWRLPRSLSIEQFVDRGLPLILSAVECRAAPADS